MFFACRGVRVSFFSSSAPDSQSDLARCKPCQSNKSLTRHAEFAAFGVTRPHSIAIALR
jgi:hypothetical protein